MNCDWQIYQDDDVIIETGSEYKKVDEFLSKLEGLFIEEIKFLPKTSSWVFTLSDGTYIYTDFQKPDEDCSLITPELTYILKSDGSITTETPS